MKNLIINWDAPACSNNSMSEQKPLITLSIIIVSYNTAELTSQAVNSVIAEINAHSNLKNSSEIIVIDNNSQDESYKQLLQIKQDCSFLEIFRNDKNLGFSKANNIGIRRSSGEYVLLLNSDTKVKSGSLVQLVKTMDEMPVNASTAQLSSYKGKLDHLGILAASLINPDGSYQPQGGSLPNLFNLMMQMFFMDDIPLIGQLLPTIQETGHAARLINLRGSKPVQKDWVAGTAMMIRRQVIQEIGLLDPNIFMYGEDVEYCLRAKKRHWDIAVDPQAIIVHYGSASSSSNQALLGEFRSLIYIFSKHKPNWQIYPAKTILFFGALLRIFLFGTILRDKSKAKVYQKALKLLD